MHFKSGMDDSVCLINRWAFLWFLNCDMFIIFSQRYIMWTLSFNCISCLIIHKICFIAAILVWRTKSTVASSCHSLLYLKISFKFFMHQWHIGMNKSWVLLWHVKTSFLFWWIVILIYFYLFILLTDYSLPDLNVPIF